MRQWQASAPSNIALIKYMGKSNAQINLATNSSLSLTMEKLKTFVVVDESTASSDFWEPLSGEGLLPIQLTDKGISRFISNWQKLKNYFQIDGSYRLQSSSNFPADCGIASSASSFAALTKVAFEVAKDRGQTNKDINLQQLAELSREASGSSCRSLFSPWAEWGNELSSFTSSFDTVLHFVVIVDSTSKKVSSSEAHARVASSELFAGRVERANQRLQEVKEYLAKGDLTSWKKLYHVCWQEFWDMHALFETAEDPFGYMLPESIEVLNACRQLWEEINEGPVVTMDAGANVHLLWRSDQLDLAKKIKSELEKNYKVVVGNGEV